LYPPPHIATSRDRTEKGEEVEFDATGLTNKRGNWGRKCNYCPGASARDRPVTESPEDNVIKEKKLG